MRHLGSFHGRMHPFGSGSQTADPRHIPSATPILDLVPDISSYRVLSVGRRDSDATVHDVLMRSSQFSTSHACDYLELWNLSKKNTYDAVVFDNNISSFELQEAARLVRCRWPRAKILLVRCGEISLDDPLYDRRLAPPLDAETLITTLSELMRSIRASPHPHGRLASALGS